MIVLPGREQRPDEVGRLDGVQVDWLVSQAAAFRRSPTLFLLESAQAPEVLRNCMAVGLLDAAEVDRALGISPDLPEDA